MAYMLEVVRGGSHIASTRQPETLNRAIAEVFGGFRNLHGVPGFHVFQQLLADEVEKRGNLAAASAVRGFKAEK